jgi:hypothetical protein
MNAILRALMSMVIVLITLSEVPQVFSFQTTTLAAWSVTGNTGTNPATNFIGTRDDVPLSFRVANQKAGSIDPLMDNTFLGFLSGVSNTEGFSNSAFGSHSLYFNTNGINNVALGGYALSSNTDGNENTASGYAALNSNTTGSQNAAHGNGALSANTTGQNNTAQGSWALLSNVSGDNNTGSGHRALRNCTIGNGNTAVGSSSLPENTTGFNNTAIGFDAGGSQTTGGNCTFLGYSAEASAGTTTNSTAIGYQATVVGSNHVRIGNTAITQIGGQVAWSNLSDARLKTNIQPSMLGLDFINQLKPVTYEFTCEGQDKIRYDGFIAQEVEQALDQLGQEFSGLCRPANENDHYSLRYSEFVVPLVKGMQEQQTEIDQLRFDNQQLRSQVNDLRSQVNEMESLKAELENLKSLVRQSFTR